MENKQDFKGMSERDLLVILNERVYQMQKDLGEYSQRIDKLETDFLVFKTEILTRLKLYAAIATAIATLLGYLIQFFLK
jgi:hypothetical protein